MGTTRSVFEAKEDVMQAQLYLKVNEPDWQTVREEKKGIGHFIRRIWSTISKYISYDRDAIFKDPNWPHLWS
jgi:hypothetical protein